MAASEGRLEIVRALIENEAEVNATDKDGWTPLHLATAEGHLEDTKVLIENGADINTKKNDGKTPLELLDQSKHPDLYKYLKSKQKSQ